MNRAIALLTAVVALCCVHLPASAEGAPAPLDTYYYDGEKKLTITPQPDLVAEFVVGDKASAVLKAVPAATEVPSGSGGPRVFKTPSAAFKPRTEAGTTTSPVFRTGTSPAGRLMALPGGMLVNFKADWSEAQVREFCQAKKLEIERRLDILGNWYVLKTEPGRASLLAANALHESGQVVSATPNWWKQSTIR